MLLPPTLLQKQGHLNFPDFDVHLFNYQSYLNEDGSGMIVRVSLEEILG